MRRTIERRGFTLIELLVVISIIALLIAILLPALGAARVSARQMQSSTQMRGIHQGMFTFAQENKGWFPGIHSDGQPLAGGTIGHTTDSGSTYRSGGLGVNHSRRLAVMMELNYFPPEYVISPGDTTKTLPDTSITSGSNVSGRNTSYAMLAINLIGDTSTNWALSRHSTQWSPSSRGREWRETANSQAIVMSDRAMSDSGHTGRVTNPNQTNFHSIWTDKGSGQWSGGALRNDGSVTFGNAPDDFKTRYSKGPTNDNDHLFHDPVGQLRNSNARLSYTNSTSTLSAE